MRQTDGALSLEEALHVLIDSMKEYFPCQSVAVILIDQDTKELRIKTSRQISYTFAKKFHKSEPGPTAERVVLQQEPMLINDLDPSSETYTDLKLEHDFSSAVLAPIVKNQRGIGYIFADRSGDEQFNESDLLHLQVIGYLIGTMIEKFELLRQRKTLSQIDDASQALQYKAFIPAMATELQRACEHDYPVGLSLLAVSAFRKCIETHGIDAAHALLAEVVTVTKQQIRDMDILARFGADEFILCLSGMDETAARSKVEQIHAAVNNEVVGMGDINVELTTGALVLHSGVCRRGSLQDILSALGKKLVEAKGNGPNSIVIGALDEEIEAE